MDALSGFPARVNGIKRREAQRESIDDLVEEPGGSEAVKYLRAVERAASDRLNRVRRNEALEIVVAPVLGETD